MRSRDSRFLNAKQLGWFESHVRGQILDVYEIGRGSVTRARTEPRSTTYLSTYCINGAVLSFPRESSETLKASAVVRCESVLTRVIESWHLINLYVYISFVFELFLNKTLRDCGYENWSTSCYLVFVISERMGLVCTNVESRQICFPEFLEYSSLKSFV